MKRREFITLLGGAAVAWPLAARAQQTMKFPTIGVLGSGSRSAARQWVVAFVRRLEELGWDEGRTVGIEVRWSEGSTERSVELIAEFVRGNIDVIVTTGSANVIAAKQARHRSSRLYSRELAIRSVPASLEVLLDRGVTPLDFRCSSPISRASGWDLCARFCPTLPGWRSWETLPLHLSLLRCARFKRQPAHSLST